MYLIREVLYIWLLGFYYGFFILFNKLSLGVINIKYR